MDHHLTHFLEELKAERGLSPQTIASYRQDLHQYIDFLSEREELREWSQVTQMMITQFLYSLNDSGKAPATIARATTSIRSFHQFLMRTHITENDPSYHVHPPKNTPRQREALTIEDIECLLDGTGSKTPRGLRDKAMMELLYGSGLQVSELIRLNVEDIDLTMGFLRCFGNNKKERMLPIGHLAKKAIESYITKGRPKLLKKAPTEALFLNHHGKRLTRQGFWKIIKRMANEAGIQKVITPHSLRQAFAIHMLENGADLESVQELLGHADISTTKRYAPSKNKRVKDIYQSSHPRA